MNARMYRGTWLLVGVPLLVAAFSVARATPLPAPTLPATFETDAAHALAVDLATTAPGREPGSANARAAAQWVAERLRVYGFRPQVQRFEAEIAGLGRRQLTNVLTVVPGRSDSTIVVVAHRDTPADTRGANDNASGTAVLIELARTYARAGAAGRAVVPEHRLVFVSTDGGDFGAHGAARFATEAAYADRIVAVLSLDALAGRRAPRLVLAGDSVRTAPAVLLQTAAERVLEETGEPVQHPGPLAQLVDLAFPFTLYEQGPFLARGIPAVTLTTARERPALVADSPAALDARRLGELGRSAQQLLVSLDENLEQRADTRPIVYFGPRLVPGWAVELVLVAAVLPFLAGAVDLFARCRRRRIPLAPALRSYRTRLVTWTLAAGLFAALALLGVWVAGEPRPIAPTTPVAGEWPFTALILYAAVVSLVWLVAREPLLPRRAIGREELLAGYTTGLLVLGVVALLVVAVNAFALVFLLPCLHAWLWLPQVHHRRIWIRGAVLAAGLAGPALLVWSFATRVGLGLDAPWYLLALAALGYVDVPLLLLFVVWLAAAAQLTAAVGGRYAPYPSAAERPPRGPLRELVHRTVSAYRRRRGRERARLRAVG